MIPALSLSEKFGGEKRFWIVYFVYSFLLCGIFAGMGFPKPHVDDPWFVGTAEHLAGTGDLYNPYIRNWMSVFTPGKYFIQFPLYPFLLAGWMKIAGISTSSVILFFALIHLSGCGFAAWFLKRSRLPILLCIFLPWMFLSMSQNQGFRGDLPGFSVFWISLVFLTYRSSPALFAAAFFACASILLWPVLLGLLLPAFLVYFAVHASNLPKADRAPWIHKSLFLWAGGSLAAFLVFLLMIDFEWSSFCHDFFQVAAMRRPESGRIWQTFLGLSWVRYDHAFLLSALLLTLFSFYWSFRRSSRLSCPVRILVFASAAGCVMAILLYAVNTFLVYFFFWLAFLAVTLDFLRLKAKMELLVIALLSLGLGKQIFQSLENLRPIPRPDTSALTLELQKYPDAVVVFDENAYRYVFDLRPPPLALAWVGLLPAPDLGASLRDKKAGQIWVMTADRLSPGSVRTSAEIVLVK